MTNKKQKPDIKYTKQKLDATKCFTKILSRAISFLDVSLY